MCKSKKPDRPEAVIDSRPALRQKAFKALSAIELGEANISEIVENLKIYQAELEVQNEELRQNQLLTETAMRRFTQIFATLPLPALVVDELGGRAGMQSGCRRAL